MRRNSVAMVCLIAWFLLWSQAARSAPQGHESRTFDFTYEVSLNSIPRNARQVRIWLPLASSDTHQTVQILNISAPVPTRITRGTRFGNRMLYAEMRPPFMTKNEFKIVYRVTRKAYSEGDYRSLVKYNQDPPPDTVMLGEYLKPDRLVPTKGIIARLANGVTRGKQGEIDKAYALYNYVFRNMRYDKSGTGWGRGDALWACDARHGNCTDFHSLFIALARAAKIPARFDIGFPLPENSHAGAIPGYHCWAEFYVDGPGWVPVDISEAWLNPSKHDFFFGSRDADRVEFSTGRDLVLTPRQAGPPVNYFVYPYVEVDGKPFDGAIEKHFSFRDVRPHQAATAGVR
ncbi:MAG TPA: transglutaminase domain-containing protein [Terriglobia bacterium]|nr:transglutaminase domain-containing protein [Terriglobia bacterium]